MSKQQSKADKNEMTAKVIQSLSEVGKEKWQSLIDEDATPFMTYDFLQAMEQSKSASPDLGWLPLHITLWRGEKLIAAVPGYVKGDSMGDFSRDWNWSNAFVRAGLNYYPKYVIGVPFTPVPGRRFLVHRDENYEQIVRSLAAIAYELAEQNKFSSVQVLYHHEDELKPLEAAGYIPRISFQFHWKNKGYESREAFLGTMKSKRRTSLRREWAAPAKKGIIIRTIRGKELADNRDLWADRAYEFYKQTVKQYMWRDPYLNQAFYRLIFERMPENIEIVAAFDQGEERFLAGAFNVSDGDKLYGRYWGCFEDVRFLHFNVCMYHSIDECIQLGRSVFEGGEGGHHKMKRGFEPTITRSAFRFVHPQMHDAVSRYLEQERDGRMLELKSWMDK